MKKLVLSQTCQGAVLKGVLESSVAFRENYTCQFVPNFVIVRDNAKVAESKFLEDSLADCDVLIYHDITRYNFKEIISRMPAGSQALKIPYVTSTIYWPTSDFFSPCCLEPRGSTSLIPWPCRVLNELIVTLREKQKIIQVYMDTDLSTKVNLVSHFNSQIKYMNNAEAGTIFCVSNLIKSDFVKQKLFHMINHPTSYIFYNIANSILRHFELPELKESPPDYFVAHQIPIHPSIIRYYGITWCDINTKFSVLDKKLDFEEYVSIYIDSYIKKYGYEMFPQPLKKKLRRVRCMLKRFLSWRCPH